MAEEKTQEEEKPSGVSGMQLIIAMVILTVLAVGGGGFLGLQLAGKGNNSGAQEHDTAEHDSSGSDQKLKLLAMPPVITNLAQPSDVWIRLECMVIFGSEVPEDSDTLLAQMSQDVVAYLRGMTLGQLQGPSGFMHLREDLNERARIRSNNAVQQIVITSMVLE